MKRDITIKIISLCSLPLLLSGCTNQYLEGNMINGDEYIGTFLSKDFSHCDVILHSKNSEQECAGVIFLDTANKQEKDNNGTKWINAIASLSCNDGTKIDSKFKARTTTNWVGEGVDQYNNKYEFRAISKKEYKQITDEKYLKTTKKDYIEAINSYVKY